MVNVLRLLKQWFGPSVPAPRKPRRAVLQMEVLEDRMCPAGTWYWNGADAMISAWSNPGGGNWLLNGAAVAAGQYPGKPGSNNDVVVFNDLALATGAATLDVAIGTLSALQFTNWRDTLAVNAGLTLRVSGGSFALLDGSTIDLGATGALILADASLSPWTKGDIIGGAMASVNVYGTSLQLSGTAGDLGVNLNIGKSAATGNGGNVALGGGPPP